MAETVVSDLIINKLTKAQYDSIVPSDTELYMISDSLDSQVSEMPTAEAKYVGQITQYVGETTTDYINGYFYKCIETESSDEKNEKTYSWEQVDVQPAGSSIEDTIEQVLDLEDASIIPSAETLNKRVFCYKSQESTEYEEGIYAIGLDSLISLTWSDYFIVDLYNGDYKNSILFNCPKNDTLDEILTDWNEQSQGKSGSDLKTLYFTCDFDYTDFQTQHVKMQTVSLVKNALYKVIVNEYDIAIVDADYSEILVDSSYPYPLYNFPKIDSQDRNLCVFAFNGSKLQPSNSMVNHAIVISNESYYLPSTDPSFYEVAYNEVIDRYYWKEVDAYIYETNELRKYDYLLNSNFLGYKVYQYTNVSEANYNKPRAEYIVAFDSRSNKYYWKHVGDSIEQVSKLEDSVITPSKDTVGQVVYLNKNEVLNSYEQSIYVIGRDFSTGEYVYIEPTEIIEMCRLKSIGVAIGTPCDNESDFNNMIANILKKYEDDSDMLQLRLLFQNKSSYAVNDNTIKMHQGTMAIVLGVNYPGQEGVWVIDTDFKLIMEYYEACVDAKTEHPDDVQWFTDFLYPNGMSMLMPGVHGVVDNLSPLDLTKNNVNKILILSQRQVGESRTTGIYQVSEDRSPFGLITYRWKKQSEGIVESDFRPAKGWHSAYHSVFISNEMVYVKASLEKDTSDNSEIYDPIVVYNLPKPREKQYIHIISEPYWSECNISASINENGDLSIEGGLEPSSLWIDVVYPLSSFISKINISVK